MQYASICIQAGRTSGASQGYKHVQFFVLHHLELRLTTNSSVELLTMNALGVYSTEVSLCKGSDIQAEAHAQN